MAIESEKIILMLLTYLEAIRQGIWEEMDRDPSVFCLGEDIGIYGGAFKVTDGFIDRFGPERVIDTPIAESAIVGAAFGASLTGMRPVAEFQFMDFIGCAFNQISNMVAKTHYLWGAPAPLVLRGPSGGYVHGGPFHSQNPEMWFVHNAGLKVICPATPYDAKGLIKPPSATTIPASSSSTNISTAASTPISRRGSIRSCTFTAIVFLPSMRRPRVSPARCRIGRVVWDTRRDLPTLSLQQPRSIAD